MSFPTWSDLNDESLIPPLGQRYSPDLGSVALMVSTAPDFRYLEANYGKETPKYPFFLGKLFTLDDGKQPLNYKSVSVAGPYLGSPYAAMILESLIARGVSKVVVLGWCGAISDKLKAGDIIMPHSAICDEGTSRNYMEMDCNTHFPTVFPNPDFTDKLKALLETKDNNIYCKRGRVWTTDAIYRETSKKVAFFQDMGAVAVEMECSALFALANYRKIDIAALLIVSDSLTLPEWKPGFKEQAFKDARKKVLCSITGIMNGL